MCIALAPVGMTKSIAAAMLRANKRLSFFFMVNHSFPHHFGAEPKAGKHSVHKFKLPDKISCEKKKNLLDCSKRRTKHRNPPDFQFVAPTIVHRWSNCLAGQVFWLRHHQNRISSHPFADSDILPVSPPVQQWRLRGLIPTSLFSERLAYNTLILCTLKG